MKKYEILEFPKFEDERGETVVFEFDQSFPFAVKRTYAVTGKKLRGAHAHLVESEVFVAISGQITARVNDGSGDKEISLDSRKKALLVRPKCWHEFYDFSPNAVLLCFSSTPYLPGAENYIADKAEFLQKFGETEN